VIGGGFIWWQDQTSLRAKDIIGLTPEHVEVEGADGTTQIHPLDEPEDQAVVEGQTEEGTALPLPVGQPPAENPANEAAPTPGAPVPVAPVVAPIAPVAVTHTAPAAVVATPAPVVAAVAAPVAPVAPAVAATAPVAGAGQVRLQFVADCWTQVTDGNGKVLLSGLKRKGETADVSGKPPFAVRLGYARGAQVSYNGQAVDLAPFTSGETARLKLGQ
jgi:cytoskeleton protein RodZ